MLTGSHELVLITFRQNYRSKTEIHRNVQSTVNLSSNIGAMQSMHPLIVDMFFDHLPDDSNMMLK